MSKTIDQRVVEMQFDNKNFEKNVSQSMSTLDKLKEKLNFSKASKNLDELNNAVKNTDMSPIGKAVEGVGQKFSALEQIAIGALRRIGEQAVATGEKLIKSLTSDNIAAGWNKFGEETMAVATLSAQGYDLDIVYDQLEKLNFFTDETSYNFTDMVKEIGKFTAAGQGLEDSVIAMEGIATWAALSGQNAQTASRAMYQLSQAMGSGIMRKEDYKSIQNASMDTQEFRQKCLDAAVALGTLSKSGEGADAVYKSLVKDVKDGEFTINQFADHLTEDAWFTSDVMMMVYRDYGKAANTLEKYMDKYSDDVSTASEAMADIEEKAKKYMAEMKAMGKDISFDEALQKVSLDEMASIPELVAEANEFMVEYNSNLAEGAVEITDVRDALVEMGYGLDEFSLKAFKAGQEARTWTDVIDSVKDAVSTGWSRTFRSLIGDQQEATELFTRFANDFWDIFASGGEGRNDALGYWREYIEPQTRQILTEASGIPGDVISAIKKNVKPIDGRDLLFSTEEGNLGAVIQLLKNLKDLLGTIKDAWNETFYGTTDADKIAQKKADLLMTITKALKKFADMLKITDDETGKLNKTGEKLHRTFKGVFAILGIVKDFISAGLNAVFKTLSSLVGGTSFDFLDLTANIGDNIVAFREFLQKTGAFEKFFGGIANAISTVIGFIKNLIDTVRELPFVKAVIDWIANAFTTLRDAIGDFFVRLSQGEKLSDIFKEWYNNSQFLQKMGEVFGGVGAALSAFWTGLVETFQNGGNVFKYILDSIINGLKSVPDALKSMGESIKNWLDSVKKFLLDRGIDIEAGVEHIREWFSKLTMDDIFRIGAGIALFVFIAKLLKGINDISRTVDGLEKLVEGFKSLVKGLQGVFNSVKSFIRAHTLQIMAAAILALVAAIVVLTFIDPARVITATACVAALALVLGVMLLIAGKMKRAASAAIIIASLAMALATLVVAVSLLANGSSNGTKGVLALAAICAAMLIVVAIVSRIMSKKSNIRAALTLGVLMLEFAFSILLLAAMVKKLENIDPKGLDVAKDLLWNFVGMIAVLMLAGSFGGKAKGAGNAILGMVISLYLILGAIRKLGDMDLAQCYTRLQFVKKIFQMFTETLALINLAGLGGGNLKGSGGAIIGMVIALWAIIGAIAVLGHMDQGVLERGATTVRSLMIVIALIVAVSHFAGKEARKAGTMLLMMSLAVGILAAFIWALSGIAKDNLKGLIAATACIVALLAVMALIVAVSGRAEKGVKSIQKLATLITLLGLIMVAISIWGDPQKAIAAAAGMTLMLLGIMAVLLAASKLPTNKGPKGLSAILITVLALSGILLALTALTNVDDALKAAGAMAIVMAGLAAVLLAVSQISNGIEFKSIISALGAAMIALVAVGAVLVVLNYLAPNLQVSIQTVGEMAGLLVVLAGCAWIMGQIPKEAEWASIISAMGAMLIAMASVTAILVLLGYLAPNIQVSWSTVGALSALLVVLAGCAWIMGQIPKEAEWIPIISAMGAMLIALASVAAVILVLNWLAPDLQMSIQTVGAMSILLLALAAGALILGHIPDTASFVPIISALGAMLLAMLAVGLLAVGIAELDVFTNGEIKKLLDEGIPLLVQLAYGLGQIVGSIVSGLLVAVTAGLPLIGQAIAGFVEPIERAFVGVGADTFAGVRYLAEALLMITASELLDGIARFFGVDTADLIPVVENLGEAVKAFAAITEGDAVNLDNIEQSAKAALILAEAATAMPRTGGLVQAILGETKSLSEFAVELCNMAPALVKYSQIISEGDLDSEAIEKSAAAMTLLADMANTLPKHNGVWQGLVGETQDMESFAKEAKRMAPALVAYGEEVKPLDTDSVEKSAAAMNILSNMASKLPKHDGFAQWITGDATLTGFAEELKAFAPSIVEYSKTVRDIDKTAVQKSALAAQALTAVKTSLPEEPGFWGIFGGKKDMDGFSEGLKKLGTGIADFSTEVSGNIDEDAVTVASSALKVLAEIQNGLGEDPGWIAKLFGASNGPDWDKFKKGMPKLAEAVKEFDKALKKDGGIDTGSVDAAGKVIQAVADIGTLCSTSQGISSGIDIAIDKLPKVADAISQFSSKVTDDTLPDYRAMGRIETILKDLNTIDAAMETTEYTSITGAITSLGKLMNVLASVSAMDTTKIQAFGESLSAITDSGIKDVILAFADTNVQTEFFDAGVSFLEMLSNGILTQQNPAKEAISTMINGMLDKISNRNLDFKTAGEKSAEMYTSGFNTTNSSGVSTFDTSSFMPDMSTFDVTSWANSESGFGGMNFDSIGGVLANKMTDVFKSPETSGELKEAGVTGFSQMFNFDVPDITSMLKGNDITGKLSGAMESALGDTDFTSKLKDIGSTDIVSKIFGQSETDMSTQINDSGFLKNAASAIKGMFGSTEVQQEVTQGSNDLVTDVATELSSKANTEKIEKSGSDFIQGFINGMNSKTGDAKKKAGEIAQAAIDSMKLVTNEHSPSRVAYGIGDYFGLGFVNALNDYATISYKAAGEVGISATDGIRDALAKSAAAFDSNIDVEPTIRPVIDLSNVDAGLAQMDNMFAATRSMDFAGDINATMNANGGSIHTSVDVDNSDVVDSLDSLREDMNAMSAAWQSMQVVMSTGELVGSLAAPMDTALGTRTIRHGRG